MKCIFCTGIVPLAQPRGTQTLCTRCGKAFREIDDQGWWGYSCEIYTPVGESIANFDSDAWFAEKWEIDDS